MLRSDRPEQAWGSASAVERAPSAPAPAPARPSLVGTLPPGENGMLARWTRGDVSYQLDRAGVLARRVDGGPLEPLAAAVTLELALAALGRPAGPAR
jgi:hypothetical protein